MTVKPCMLYCAFSGFNSGDSDAQYNVDVFFILVASGNKENGPSKTLILAQ